MVLDYFHTIGPTRSIDYPFADLDISGSARSLFGAVQFARGVLVSALGEKKPVLVASEGDFAALVEGRHAFPATPAQGRTIVGVVAPLPIQGTPDPKPKKRSVKDAPWFPEAKGMPMTLSIPKLVRESALRAADRAGILGYQLIVFITLAPNIDGLSPPEREQFWRKCLNRLRAYCRKREKKLGIPFPAVYLATRESDPITHLGEHLHLLAHAPDRAEADHMAEVVRKWFVKKRRKATARGGAIEGADGPVDGDAVEDPNAAHAKRVDTRERFRGGKLRSVVTYVFKAAHPQSWKFDSTILWKLSGAIAGKRVFISRNLTNRDVVAATRDAVEAVELARQEVVQARRDGFVPAPSSATATTSPTEIVSDVPAAPAPVLAAAVEPEPIEPDICPTSGSAGLVHRDEAEHRGMDVVEVEIRPAVSAPAPIPRELDIPAVIDAGAIPAAIEAVVHAEVAAPLLPTSAAITPAVGPATATPDDPIPAATVSPAPAAMTEPGPVSSSRKAPRLASLAVLGRSVARGVVAGAGWITARLGGRAPPHPATAPPAGQPRAPLVHPSTIPAAGAFFGAPMLW